ncbi:kynureninase [Pseudidiomarina aestuarii]|uniref:Kynureninase n=2 Tax=Pseudidiomarina aestuarii TaxID=624146 RepID=A0A7Z7ESQ1_9GAMM|nr:kynureninase [Pseudidiomarina aestuarii]
MRYSMINEAAARKLDSEDVLAHVRERFVIPDGTIYLDGNSLGLLTHAAQERVQQTVTQEWGQDLITSWNAHQWIDLPLRVGDRIGQLIGAATGQVVCCDSISVNLTKALVAALSVQTARGQRRHKVISTVDNFPTDLYMVQGLQDLLGKGNCELQLVEEKELNSTLTDDVSILMVTEVNFRTGRRLPIAELTRLAHENNILVIVDLAHSAGAMPVCLDEWQVDFAVGCTYKYLNGGPGAPAFVYAAERHHATMQQPLRGWMGHAKPFEFSNDYQPAAGIRQFLAGTPPVTAMVAVEGALTAFDHVDLKDVRDKSLRLARLFHDLLHDAGLTQMLQCIAPEQEAQRGSQLAYAFEHAYGLCQALIERGVIADFRAPNYIRFGFTPLYTSYHEIWLAVQIIRDVIATEDHLDPRWQQRNAVT